MMAVAAASSAIPTALSSREVETRVADRLENYVKGCSAPFTCGGHLKLDEPVSVTLLAGEEDKTGGEPIIIQVPKALRDGKLREADYSESSYREEPKKKRAELLAEQASDLSRLIGSVPQAPFGRGGETIYDPTVRDALQLKADKFELSIPQEIIDGILEHVKKEMDLQTDVVAEPYSLNIYQKRGKFRKHKDTPRGDDMLGTLVIALPSWFTGGRMSVSLGDEEKEYFGRKSGNYYWQKYSRPPPNPCDIQWCAFFADVDHEIHEVEEGIRITAAYLLRRKDHSSASGLIPRLVQGQDQANRIKEAFLGGLCDSRFLPNGGKVGFPCLHLYTNTEVFPGQKDSSQALTPKQIGKLKGRDLMIANAAVSAGLSVKLLPFLGHDYSCDGDEGDYVLTKFPKKKRCPRRMCDDRILDHFNTNNGDRAFPDSVADLWILDFQAAAKANAGETEWNAEGYFGNEASGISFYVKACLIIEVPTSSDSRGIPIQLPQKKKRKTAQKLKTAQQSNGKENNGAE